MWPNSAWQCRLLQTIKKMLWHRSKHLMETFILEVLFVCKSVLRGNTKKIYGTKKTKKKRKLSSEELKCTAGQHLSCQRSEHNEGRFVVAEFRCEIPDMSDHIPALVCYFSDPELEAPTDLVTSEVTHHSFRATWTAPAGPVDKYRVTYVQVAGGPTLEVRYSFHPILLPFVCLWVQKGCITRSLCTTHKNRHYINILINN